MVRHNGVRFSKIMQESFTRSSFCSLNCIIWLLIICLENIIEYTLLVYILITHYLWIGFENLNKNAGFLNGMPFKHGYLDVELGYLIPLEPCVGSFLFPLLIFGPVPLDLFYTNNPFCTAPTPRRSTAVNNRFILKQSHPKPSLNKQASYAYMIPFLFELIRSHCIFVERRILWICMTDLCVKLSLGPWIDEKKRNSMFCILIMNAWLRSINT